jgi:hypothetical protein
MMGLQDIALEDLPPELLATAPPEIRDMLGTGVKVKTLDLSGILSKLLRRPSQADPTLTFRFLDEGGALAASPFAQAMEMKVKDLAVQAVRNAIPRILDQNEQAVIDNAAQIERTRARLVAENDDAMRQMLAYRNALAAQGIVSDEATHRFAAFVKSRTPVVPDLVETPHGQPRTANRDATSASKPS